MWVYWVRKNVVDGTLYEVSYKLNPDGLKFAYYYTHNWRGDIVGIYNGNGELRVKYAYDSWGNVISITDENGDAITNANHIGNLNPFRYRGYYMDTETGMYYLMSRYYDPVTHRFLNADGYFQTGTSIVPESSLDDTIYNTAKYSINIKALSHIFLNGSNEAELSAYKSNLE